jgi:UDP-GlcNAc:undecaprenyl-phosphate/decaprenyl-phosphate GlcNAc-1-phosphate transferase
MSYAFFLPTFLTSFVVSIFLLTMFIFLNRKYWPKNRRESDRHIHHPGISRFGGAAIIISFIFALLADKNLVVDSPLSGVLFASAAILIFGIIDDFKELSWKIQLIFQISIVALVYLLGARLAYISNPFGGMIMFSGTSGYIFGLLVAIVWAVFIMNAINWIDGIDGASGGISIICALAIFFLSLKPEVNQPPIEIITAALVGGILGFLFFNFHPAKILAGTSGAMFMGFILAILAILAGAKIATTLLVLIIPAVDALWVIFQRYRSQRSIFSPDKRHLHFRLLELGWSQQKICLFYYGITALLAVLALNTRAMGKLVVFISFGIIIISILFLIRRKTSGNLGS